MEGGMKGGRDRGTGRRQCESPAGIYRYLLATSLQIVLQRKTWNKWQMLCLKTVKFRVQRIFWASLQGR